MKKIMVPIFLIVLASCNVNSNSSVNPTHSVTFKVSQSNYTVGDTVAAVLQNNSSQQVTYGNPFQVRQKKDGKWKYIGPSLYFTLVAYELSPGEKTTYRFALSDSLFPNQSLPGERYRVTTSVGMQNKDRTLKTQSFQVKR